MENNTLKEHSTLPNLVALIIVLGLMLFGIVLQPNGEESSNGEQIFRGNVVMGHEARTFTPCGAESEELWVLGDSPAYSELLKTYQTWVVSQQDPYAQLFVVLAGNITDAPTDGFGADYSHGFEATQLVKVASDETCSQKADLIVLNTPAPNESVESPLTIKGQARGFWFFEGDFPVVVTDWDGRIIGEGFVTAEGDWMTEEFVPFSGVIEFEIPEHENNGTLILRKDNASGLPEHDDALEIPILFDIE